MPTPFQIPRILRSCCDDSDVVRLEGQTVGELLQDLRRVYPRLHRSLCDETGAVRRHIHLFVNDEFIGYRHGLDTPVQQWDVVSVFQAVSGG
ncbi:MAG TPA: molybdopterin synthase sulfur carrier subunit [Planctomycetaceae bacterium]|nr:molybdopterin synthase sulfur carrier subunit [Planctomycetaceae bacterium]